MKKDTRKGFGCLFLFALPFAAVGVGALYLIGTSLWDYGAMRSWVETEARIDRLELVDTGDSDSESHRIDVTYRYRFEGRDYVGRRVSLQRHGDGVGEYQERTYRELERRRRSGEAVSCWVDPRRPEASVLFRELRLELLGFYAIFAIAFGGVGLGLLGGGVYAYRKTEREAALETRYPGEPWRHREEWSTGRIRSSARESLLGAGIFTTLWVVVTSPVLFFLPEEVEKGNVAALVGLVFPIAGAGLLVWTARKALRLWKYRESIFELATVPGVVGGRLAGTVHTSVPLRREAEIEVRLSCIRRYRSGTGDDATTREDVLWQQALRLPPGTATGLGRESFPVAFDVPSDGRPTDPAEGEDRVLWRLDVSADVPGVDYEAQFEVPVFRTRGGGSTPRPAGVASTKAAPAPDLARSLERAGARVELAPGGRRYVFPRGRELGTALFTTLVFAVSSGVLVVLLLADVPWMFTWVLGLFDVLLLWGTLDLWLYSSTIEVHPGALSWRAGWPGLARSERIAAADVEGLRAKRGLQSGERQYYQLELARRGGRPAVLAKRIPQLHLAEGLASEIERTLEG